MSDDPHPRRLRRASRWLRSAAIVTAGVAAIAGVPLGAGGPTAQAQQDTGAPWSGAQPAAACPDGGVPRAGFPDVVGSTHEPSVDCLAWYGIARGVRLGAFAPSARVRRDQTASFVARLLEAAAVALPDPRDQGFDDLHGNPHADRINQLAELDIVRGTTAASDAPARAVRRDQMAAFLVRAYELVHGEELDAPPSGFDNTGGTAHETAIDKAAAAGIARGATPTTFRPADPVRRDQMASFLARTLERAAADGHLAPATRCSPRSPTTRACTPAGWAPSRPA